MTLFKCKTDYLMGHFPSYGANSKLIPKYIVIHDTASSSSAVSQAKRLYNNSTEYNNGIAHYYVDEKEAFQLVRDDIKAYHCGDGGDLPGNGQSIGIEVCRSLSSGDFKSEEDKVRYKKALDNAYKVATDLCEQYGISPDNIRQHRDFSATACPYTQKMYFGSYTKALANAKKVVKELLGNVKPTPPKPTPPKPEPSKKWVQISWIEADKLTTTSKSTGSRVREAKVSGSYPSNSITFGHTKPSVSSQTVLFKEMKEYTGYILDSVDGIVWFEITNIKGTKGEKIFLDLNQPGLNYFYYNSTDNATILKVLK